MAQDKQDSETDRSSLELDELGLDEMEDLDEIKLMGEVGVGEGRGEGEGTAGPRQEAATTEPAEIDEYAAKVYTMELVSGEFVRGSGSQRSFVRMWNGENVDRARLMGTVVHKFSSSDGTYSALTLDDGTETIRIKGWREEAGLIAPVETGQIVDVIGQVREYNGEIYISPVSINPVLDPNWEPLRELEIYKLRKVKKNDLQL